MDIRRGVTPLDDTLLRWLEPRGLPIGVLLTKADKLGRGAALAQERRLAEQLGPAIKVTRFSALTGDGVATARQWLEDWLGAPK
jgi:GTP-binding protein